MINLKCFDGRAALVDALCRYTVRGLNEGITAAGLVTWAVSGGSTPKPLFEQMSEENIDWKRVRVALVDERWVNIDHPRSNERLMRDMLERGESEKASFVGMKTEGDDPFAVASDVERRYRRLPPIGPLLLGLGSDGHTASLFPDAEGLAKGLDSQSSDLVCAIKAHRSEITGVEVLRMTLTLAAIKNARLPHLMITGDAKRDVLEKSVRDGTAPIAKVIAGLKKPLDVFWSP